MEALGSAGLAQYEISNFCRPGFESRHNLRYWQRRPYLGLGLDASSMLRALHEADGDGQGRVLRSTTASDLKAFFATREPEETTWLTPAQQHEEAWFLGLRLNAGVEVAALEREFGAQMVSPALEVVSHLSKDGLLSFDGGKIRLTARGQLLSNNVFQEFLDLADKEPVS